MPAGSTEGTKDLTRHGAWLAAGTEAQCKEEEKVNKKLPAWKQFGNPKKRFGNKSAVHFYIQIIIKIKKKRNTSLGSAATRDIAILESQLVHCY